MSATVSGVAMAGGVAQNSASVDLWLASRFTSPPAQGTAPPAGSADYGPVVSGPAFGGPGAFTITGVADGDYYVRAVYSGTAYWIGPVAAIEDADVVHIAGAETITGAKTFSGGLTVSGGAISLPNGSVGIASLTGVLPIASGGTGSATKNFVDLTTPQTVAGAKTFSDAPVLNAGLTVASGPVVFPNGSIPAASVQGGAGSGAGVDVGSTQTITGPKTFDSDLVMIGGRIIGQAIATPTAPVVSPTPNTGTTTWAYQVVATTYDGRDSIPSATGQTTTGPATLSGTAYNALTWPAVAGAASYKILRYNGSAWQLIAGGITGTSYTDTGASAPAAYTASTINPGGEITGTSVQSAGVYFKAYASATTGPGVVADTTINMDTATFDPLGLFSTSAHTWTVPVSGIYIVWFTHSIVPASNLQYIGDFRVNGTAMIFGAQTYVPAGGTIAGLSVGIGMLHLNKGDSLSTACHAASAACSVYGDANATVMGAMLVAE